jgi:hypothetical protein
MFKTIKDFVNFKTNCIICSNPMQLALKCRHEFGMIDFRTFYTSEVKDGRLVLLQHRGSLDGKMNTVVRKICEIDLETNKNYTHVKEFQNFFLKHTCHLEVMCYNKACQSAGVYFYKSDKLYIDGKNNKLYATKLDFESIGVKLENEFYILSCRKKDNNSMLTNHNKLIGTYPYINLTKIDSMSAAVKKIKTLLVFG